MDPNQENIPPQDDSIEHVVANVRNGAIDAMAAQIDGSAKNAKTHSLGLRRDDPKKIEQLYGNIDGVGLLFSLTVDIHNYLESISNASINSIVPSSSSLQPAIDALAYVASESKLQLAEMRKLANNTKAKKRAASSHNKVNKLAKQQANDDQLQRRSLASTKPKKMLQLAIKNTKESLKALETSHLPHPLARP